MELSNYMGLFGGLALFLYGMQMMSTGLEASAGNKMKEILEKLTSNRFLGVVVGAVITAIIQSSSATTVMVVGFVNAKMMTLQQAVWIIMGANIGTTITGQLIALDVGAIAPALAFLGVAIIVFGKNQKWHHYASILAGLGILFIGMDMMSGAMKPLGQMPEFVELLTKFENPILGIIAGAVFTAIIQSSSASVGILQVLANGGVIGLESAAFVLFGQNIGTCITAFLASIGTTTNAKRTTVIHILFNVIGTCIFTVLCMTTPIISLMKNITDVPAAQIANLHTTFNIVTTIILIPFGTYLTKIAVALLKEKDEETNEFKLNMNIETLGVSAIAQQETENEIGRMLELTSLNVMQSLESFSNNNIEFAEIQKREDFINMQNKEISKFITKAISHEITEEGSQIFNSYYIIVSNLERIADHAKNICEHSEFMKEKNLELSKSALEEVDSMKGLCKQVLQLLSDSMSDYHDIREEMKALEQTIDDMTLEYRGNMFERMRIGTCHDEGSIIFSEVLTDFERIGDHALNISKEIYKIGKIEH